MKTTMLASVLLLAGIASASAAPLAYTFAQSDGTEYCDGVTLKFTGSTYVGTHTGSCEAGDYAGGLVVKLKGTKDRIIDVVTTDTNNSSGAVFNYVLDLNSLTWTLYIENTSTSAPYAYVNSGELIVGPDTNAARVHSLRASGSPVHRQ